MNGADWDADMMLKRYIYDYMIRKNLNVSSEIFKDEADVIMNHIAIDDSQRGFLSEWWVIFWEMYTARQSRVGVEEDASEDFSLNPSNQEGNNSQAMGNGLSSKEPSLETQRNMNDMMIPPFDSSLISVDNMNNLHPNNSVNESQQMKIKNSSAMNPFSGLKEDWLKQFNFSKSAIHGSTSLPPVPGNGDVLQSATQQPQQVGIGSTSMSMEWPGFHSPKLNTYLRFSKKKSDQSSSLIQKDKQNADEGIGSTSMNMEWQGFQPPRLGNYLHASEQNPHQSSSLLPKDIFQSQAIISLSRPAIENLLKMERRKEPWIVVLYAPWCPFCKTMEVSYVAMAEKLSGSGTKVGKFQADGDQYLFAQQELYLLSFPTVLFFSKFASQPIKYPSQKRDVDSLLAFVRALNC